jgi:hypothetical protein
MASTHKCGNELSGSIKCEEFFDYLKTFQLLKKDSATCSMADSATRPAVRG